MSQSALGRSVRRRGITRTDLMMCLCIVAVCAAAVPAPLELAHERSRQMRCAANLRQIGLAIQLYANENKGAFPRSRFDPDRTGRIAAYTHFEAKDPFAADGPDSNDVTAALYLLLRTQDVGSDVFVCPSTTQRMVPFSDPKVEPLPPLKFSQGEGKPVGEDVRPTEKPLAKTPLDISNFPGPDYLSYSYINPYPSKAARNAGLKLNFTLMSDFAIASDMNPGGAGPVKVKREDLPQRIDPAVQNHLVAATDAMKLANSPNHGGLGQNVLFADGHVEFQPTPWCGMKRSSGIKDNIFTAEFSARDPKGEEAALKDPTMAPSIDEKDSILVPVALSAAVDAKPAASPK